MTDNTKMREALLKFGDENPSLDLDFRLHTHGKYLTQEKAIVASRAFKAGAAWQAAQSEPEEKPDFEKLESLGWQIAVCAMCGTHASAIKPVQSVPVGYRLQPLSEFDAYQSVIDDNDALHRRIRELEAQRVPEGWKLVPVEPTDEMIDHGCDAANAFRVDMCRAWDAMLTASPEVCSHD